MKNNLVLVFMIAMGFHTATAQNIACDDLNKITTKLQAIRETDQNSRNLFIKQAAENDAQKTKELALKMKATDKENQQYIGELIDTCGWPKGLSADDNHTIFLVIDHAEAPFMAKYFPILKEQADLGIVEKSDLATLQDRMLLRNGKMQLYGTQTFKIGAIVHVWPIDTIDGLNERRKAMGLIPMTDYLKEVKERYRSEVSWDKTLTVEEAQQKMQEKS